MTTPNDNEHALDWYAVLAEFAIAALSVLLLVFVDMPWPGRAVFAFWAIVWAGAGTIGLERYLHSEEQEDDPYEW